MNVSQKTRTIAKLGVLCAISIALVSLIHISIFPAVSFLEYDPADISILITTFALGPWAGLAMTFVIALIQGITVSAASGVYGIVMHIIATGVYSVVAGFIYQKHKTKKTAVYALIFGALAMAVIMVPANLILTPIYLNIKWGLDTAVAKSTTTGLLPWIILFNVVKAGINGLVTFLVYKRVSPVLHDKDYN